MPVQILTDEIKFPSPNLATEDGLVALGGDLRVERLVEAYRNGIFPWYSEGEPLLWWSPHPRLVVFPRDYKPAKSLRPALNQQKFAITFDRRFEDVIYECARIPRDNQHGTWITPEMQEAYVNLHKAGYAHSVETYQNDELVGGLYGVSLGKAFFGESMFYKVSDASKIAFHYLVEFCRKNDFHLIDAQQDTPHLKRLGGVLVSRKDFLFLLGKALEAPTIKGKWNYKE
ncbi:MAG: leucyl/phenylalanyl-tRNA--protein transferase [Bacteroidales bacterium]|nr:leucyl/phenylalanyl-tRNA--protein transferase [Bacteroidales bacterium]MCF8338194.1 leucyl/phenylalanyl-tRNA--protein transferase [Bacteroidales bacterium]